VFGCCIAGHMTLHGSAAMAEGRDTDVSKCSTNQFAAVNGHIADVAGTTSDFASSILGHPSTILIVTNVADATFVSTEVRVTGSVRCTARHCVVISTVSYLHTGSLVSSQIASHHKHCVNF